jgi:hypothetical protein
MRSQILQGSDYAVERRRRCINPIGLRSARNGNLPHTTWAIRRFLTSLFGSVVNRLPPILLRWVSVIFATVSFLPHRAWAHVKWFEPYDVTAAPTPLRGVMTEHFLAVCAGFTLLVVGSFCIDRLVVTKLPAMVAPGRREDLEERVVRAGTGAFFMALFATGGTILTPELQTTASWPAWLQFGIAISMLSKPTCVIGSLGLLTLYGYGIALYGVFHLSDYPMFLGLAAYLGLTSWAKGSLRSQRMVILYVSICVSLMWGAVEKWAYPQWTLPLLAERPYLTFGMVPQDFMIIAGFVEFAFAFYILTGHALLRLAILGLGTIFASAILDFGKIDAIGHLPILVAFIAMFIHGPTRLHLWLHDNSDSIFRKARTTGTAFTATVLIFFGAYYGLQYAEYGRSAHFHNKFTALSAPTTKR